MKLVFVFLLTLFCTISYSQTINIPDQNFERVLVEEGIDSDKTVNGRVLRIDVQSVTFLDLFNKKIKSLKGIEEFTSLTYLDCRNNYLSSLDLSKNISLSTLYSDVNNSIKTSSNDLAFNWFDQ
ncbi:hypothetical protein [Algibacter aquimarinus]|uniref:Leucine-rich repeat domain-containing protein n=1 Tax=Algibacter aquimarinus TaxID=1136748 RepID=A0ABP9HHJ7_9FLAO